MKLERAIKERRSIRKYHKKDIPKPVIEELLELARYAPSSMNGQPWHFIIIKKDSTKKKLAAIKNKYCPEEKRMYRADFIRDAALIIVVCVDKEKSYDREIENGILASSIILLGAHSRGLGSVYLSAYSADEPGISNEIRQILGIPSNVDPISIIPMGYPDEKLKPKELRPLTDLIHHERF
jgi:nitroreductase